LATGPERGYRPKIAARYGGPDATCMAGEFWRAGAGDRETRHPDRCGK